MSVPIAPLVALLLALEPGAAIAGTLNLHPTAPAPTRGAPAADAAPPPTAAPPEPAAPEIAGRSEGEWREGAVARRRSIDTAQAALAECEAHEAPPPYRDYAGYYRPAARPRDGIRWVEIRHCDDARADLAGAQRDLEDYEELARRSAVPPGWLR